MLQMLLAVVLLLLRLAVAGDGEELRAQQLRVEESRVAGPLASCGDRGVEEGAQADEVGRARRVRRGGGRGTVAVAGETLVQHQLPRFLVLY